jgi:hypothetical protein
VVEQVEDHDRQGVVHAERDGGGVHDLEAAVQHVHVGDVVELRRVGSSFGSAV